MAIYINTNFTKHCKKLNFDCLNSEFDFEATGVYIGPNFKLVIISLYKVTKYTVFLQKLEELLDLFGRPSWKNYYIALGGDLNAAFDVTENKISVNELKNILRQFNYN